MGGRLYYRPDAVAAEILQDDFPSFSATLITSLVILGLLALVLLASGVLYENLDHIGRMVTMVVQGFDRTGIQYLLPPFTQE